MPSTDGAMDRAERPVACILLTIPSAVRVTVSRFRQVFDALLRYEPTSLRHNGTDYSIPFRISVA